MSRLFAVLTLSFLMVGCEALWEDDEADLTLAEKEPAANTAIVAESNSAESRAAESPKPVAAPSEAAQKFSWEAPAVAPAVVVAPAVEAPRDPSKVRIIEIRENLGLVAFVRSEAPALKSLLQLIKDGKVMVVEVVSVKGTQIVANILPGQKNAPAIVESDIVNIASQGALGAP